MIQNVYIVCVVFLFGEPPKLKAEVVVVAPLMFPKRLCVSTNEHLFLNVFCICMDGFACRVRHGESKLRVHLQCLSMNTKLPNYHHELGKTSVARQKAKQSVTVSINSAKNSDPAPT